MKEITVSFPGLGIGEGTISSVAFKIGDFEIMWYGICIALGMVMAIAYAAWRCKQQGIKVDDLIDIAIFAIFFGVIGARLYYVAFSPSQFNTIWDVLNLRSGGLAIYGGILAGAITVFVVSRVKKIPFLVIADCCTPGIILAQAIGRWGNFFNSEAFGRPTDLPWKLYIAPQYRPIPYTDNDFFHPTFLYESILDLGLFFVLLYIAKKHLFKKNGNIALTYLILYSVIRIFVEHYRIDSACYISGIPVATVVSASIIILSSVALIWNNLIKKEV